MKNTSLPPSNFKSAACPCVCCEVFAPPTLALTAGLRYALVTLSAPNASLAGCKTFSARLRRFPSKCLGKALGSPVFVAVSSARLKFLVIALATCRAWSSFYSLYWQMHSWNACLASCSYLSFGLSPVASPSLASLKKKSAKAPTIKVETSVKVARPAHTKTKQRPIIISPSIVVFGLPKMRSISTFVLEVIPAPLP
jgi:hypothetical protein